MNKQYLFYIGLILFISFLIFIYTNNCKLSEKFRLSPVIAGAYITNINS